MHITKNALHSQRYFKKLHYWQMFTTSIKKLRKITLWFQAERANGFVDKCSGTK